MKRKITKRCVDEIAAAEKPQFIFDTELPGFVLKVTPTGHKTYQLRYRMGGRDTPLKTFTIGKHGPLSPTQARHQAQSLLGDVRRGIDPAAEKSRQRAAELGGTTLERLSTDFLEIYCKTKLKPRSLEEYERYFRSHINPRIGGLNVADVSYGDIERLHHAMRGTPIAANRAVATLSKFFSWAIRGGYRPDRRNPCQGLQKFKEQARQRYLSESEISALGAAIRECETDGRLNEWQAAVIRLLLLTGLRRDELRTLRWENVGFERRVLFLPDTKTGQREFPLSSPALSILSELTHVDGNPFVFVGHRTGKPIGNLAKPWRRVIQASGVDATRIHDLRHTAASIAVAAGASLPLIGGVLGHKSPQTTARYAHLQDDPVRTTSEQIGEVVEVALKSNFYRAATSPEDKGRQM